MKVGRSKILINHSDIASFDKIQHRSYKLSLYCFVCNRPTFKHVRSNGLPFFHATDVTVEVTYNWP